MKFRFLYLTIVLLAVSAMAWGQGFTASILGTVTDNTGAVVPQATVTVTNIGTGVEQVTKTDGSGNYTVPQLAPGNYRVAAETQGFKRAVREPITLEVDARQKIDFALELGQVSENVTVTAETAQIQAETATVGTAVTSTQTSELPLNGRNFLQLNLLVPGALPNSQGSNLSGQGGSIEVHGMPENWNYFWVDGMDNESMSIGQYIVNVPPYTIEEFRVMSPTYDAEFGRVPGAQINVITRSGGNTYHGDTYLFIRNSVFDAKNFFDPVGSIPAYRRGQYGGDLGGRLIRDKLFFYGAFEGQTFAQGESALNIVPTHQETLGNFSDISTVIRDPASAACRSTGAFVEANCTPFAGNIIPANRLNQAGLDYAAFFPPPNIGTNTLLVSPTGTDSDNVVVAKGDWVARANDRVAFRYAFEDHTYHQPISQFSNQTNIPGFGIDNTGAHDITTGIVETHIFSPNLVSEVRFGWDRYELQYHAEARFKDYCTAFGIQGCDDNQIDWYPPAVSFNSVYSTVGGGNDQYGPFDTTFFHPTLTWIKGRHTMKFGYEYYHFFTSFDIGLGVRASFAFRGTWSGNPLSDLLLGLPYTASRTIIADESDDGRMFVSMNQTAGFVQDDYRLSNHLTLTLGLRYEYQFPATESRDHYSTLNIANGVQNAVVQIAGQNGVGSTMYNGDHDMFAPRFGFAWSPTDKWAIRGGYGIFYQTINQNNTLNLHSNPPFSNAYTVTGDGSTININTGLVTGLVANAPNWTIFNGNMKNGSVQEYSIGAQRQLMPSLLVDVGYVGNRGRDIDATIPINTPTPGPGTVQTRRPDPAAGTISYFTGAFTSQYDGLEVRIERRLTRGMQFLTSYTLSRSLDDAGTPQNPRNLAAQWGPSTYDSTHHLAFSYVYQLPFGKGRTYLSNMNRVEDALLGGWQLNGIFQFRSGQPFTPILASDNTNTQQNQDRPNLVGDPNASSGTCHTGTPTCWVNSAAFVTPAQYTFGTDPKGSLRGPNMTQLDFALAKNFVFTEARKIEFRAEAFNILNHPNFGIPNATLGPTFGLISVTSGSSRQMQFGARFVF